MLHPFGSARKLFLHHQHPRLLLGESQLKELTKKCRQGVHRRIVRTMEKDRIEPVVKRLLESEDLARDLSIYNQSGWHSASARAFASLTDLAFLAASGNRPMMVDAIRRILIALPEAHALYPSEERLGLGVQVGGGVAIAADLCHHLLSEKERLDLHHWLRVSVLDKVLARPAAPYYNNAGQNIPLGQSLSALYCTLLLDGEPGQGDLSAERDELIRRFRATLSVCYGPDGYPAEDIGYGTVVGGTLAVMLHVLHRAGLMHSGRDYPPFNHFGDAILHFVQPWGEHLSNTGDHGDDFGKRELVLGMLARQTGDPALLWLLGTLSYDHGRIHPENLDSGFHAEVPFGQGMTIPATMSSLLIADLLPQARHPRQTKPSTAFRDRARGLVSFRSGWNDDDCLVVFDGSQRNPAAAGHGHASCGHFSLSAVGEYFSIDTGRYNIEQNCHSVVLVNGRSGRDTGGQWKEARHGGNLTGYRHHPIVDSASVDSSHQHDCIWARRTIGVVKGKGARPYVWVVDDINACDGPASYWWQLQTAPENRIRAFKRHATVTGHRHGNQMDVHFAFPTTGPEDPLKELRVDEGVASSTKYLKGPDRSLQFARPADMIHGPVYRRPRLVAVIEGLNGCGMGLLLPRARGESPAQVKRLSSVPGTIALRVTFDQVEDTLVFAFHHQILESDGVAEMGQWCHLRRRRSDGRLLHRMVHRDW